MPESMLDILSERIMAMREHDHGGYLDEMIQAMRLLAKSGHFCRFYDKVTSPR
jgi:hypothetical protein